MAKEILYRGKTLEQMKQVSLDEFMKMIPSRSRRSLKRGFTDAQKKLLLKIRKANEGKYKKLIKTHCRDIVIIPEMLGNKIHVHNGKVYTIVDVELEMLGHFLGEFSKTRSNVKHSAPGIGATRSSAAASVK